MIDKIINVNLLKEPFNWVIVPLVLIMAGLGLSFVMMHATPQAAPSDQDTGGST